MIRKGLSEEVSSSAKDSKVISVVGGGGRRAFRVEDTARAKARRWAELSEDQKGDYCVRMSRTREKVEGDEFRELTRRIV